MEPLTSYHLESVLQVISVKMCCLACSAATLYSSQTVEGIISIVHLTIANDPMPPRPPPGMEYAYCLNISYSYFLIHGDENYNIIMSTALAVNYNDKG